MAFEPLRTDEKLDESPPKSRDMDAQMLFGCSGFIVASVGGYVLSVWPWFAFDQADKLTTVVTCSLLGLLPSGIVGVVCTRKFGLAGACGFVAGALTTAVFLYLRLQQTFLAAMAKQLPQPDYPSAMMGVLPFAWVLLVLMAAFLLLPKGDSPFE